MTPSAVTVLVDDGELGALTEVGVLRHERSGAGQVVRFSYSDAWLEEFPDAFPIIYEITVSFARNVAFASPLRST